MNTPRFALIGHPLEGSLSPELFSRAYDCRWPYELVDEPDFEAAWARFIRDYDAVNVTAPFKQAAALRADIISDEVRRTGAANILKKSERGIEAYNSDYRGLLTLIPQGYRTVAVIGTGGAGKAATAAAEDLGLDVRAYRHDGLPRGLTADIVIYTLPQAVDGIRDIECSVLIEANYKNPCMKRRHGYISGKEWLIAQARTGYALMTGAEPFADGSLGRNAFLQQTEA